MAPKTWVQWETVRDPSMVFAMDNGVLSKESVGMHDTYLAFKICTRLFSIKQKFKF